MAKPISASANPVHHKAIAAWLLLIVGILFLIQDYAPASMTWWKVSWQTVAFIFVGLLVIHKHHHCKK